MRLSIGGLELDPGAWRRAFEDGGSYASWEPAEDQAAAVALGYMAQARGVCVCVQQEGGGRLEGGAARRALRARDASSRHTTLCLDTVLTLL